MLVEGPNQQANWWMDVWGLGGKLYVGMVGYLLGYVDK